MSFPSSATDLLDKTVDEMIGRGDMTHGEMCVNCVLSAMARLMRNRRIPKDKEDAQLVILEAITKEYAENKDNWL